MTSPVKGTERRARARRGEGEHLREEILEAATRLVAETGSVDAVSMRMIADAVGVSPPSLYLHFADKSELVFACCDAQFSRLLERVTVVLAEVEQPLERFLALGRTYAAWGLEHPEAYRLLFLTPHPHIPDHVDHAELAGAAAYGLLVACTRDAIAAGDLRGGDPEVVAVGCWAAVHGAVSLLLTKHEHAEPGLPQFPEPDVLVEHVLTTYLAGLRSV